MLASPNWSRPTCNPVSARPIRNFWCAVACGVPPQCSLLAADEQTAGRGRQRRPWIARPRTALLFSLAVPLPELLPTLPAIAPACGAALADHLIERGVEARLKWPNDLLLDGRKLGGILCELAVDADGQSTLVIGVGINVLLTADDRARIGQPAAALADVLPARMLAGEREAWIAALATTVLALVRRFAAEGFAPWRRALQRAAAGARCDGRHHRRRQDHRQWSHP